DFSADAGFSGVTVSGSNGASGSFTFSGNSNTNSCTAALAYNTGSGAATTFTATGKDAAHQTKTPKLTVKKQDGTALSADPATTLVAAVTGSGQAPATALAALGLTFVVSATVMPFLIRRRRSQAGS